MKHDSTTLKNANVLQSVTRKITTTALYSETTKLESCFKDHKNAKLTKRLHACKGYACTYSDEVLSFFNPELQLKDASFAIRKSDINDVFESVYGTTNYIKHTKIFWKRFGLGH